MSQARRTRHFAQSDSNTINVDAISLKKLKEKTAFHSDSSPDETPQSWSKILRCASYFNSFLGVSSGDETRRLMRALYIYVKIRNLHLGSVILCRGSRSQSRLQAVSYFCLQSYCTRNLSTRAAKPGAARNEGVSPRRKNSRLVSIPDCNNNVVVCNRAGWDKNLNGF